VTDPVLLELYDPAGLSEMTDYSDLHYQQTEVSVGGTYRFTPQLYAALEAAYEYYKDKDPYVYGDLDGEAWRGYLGVGYKF
jgi:predicted porin